MQVQINLRREGNRGPQSGNNQLLSTECSIEYTYEASKNSYTGEITAKMSDGLTMPTDGKTATVLGRFVSIDEE